MRPRAARDRQREMPLIDHLREFRTRLLLSCAAVAAAAIASWAFYAPIFHILRQPLDDAVAAASARGAAVTLSMTTMTDAFTMQMQVSLVVGIIAASPYLLFHLWRFVTPGLRRRERRWVVTFLAAAVPLFGAGIAFGYYTLPQALIVLLGFTPEKVSNIIPVPVYIGFLLRMLLVFGASFVAPVLIVIMNLAGVLSAKDLFSKWRGIIMGCAVFGAVATPTGDPFNMLLVASPIAVIIFAAGAVCAINERIRGRRVHAEPELADDEASPL